MAIFSSNPGCEPQRHATIEEAITSLRAEAIAQGKNVHGKCLVGVLLPSGCLATIEVYMDDLDKLIGYGDGHG